MEITVRTARKSDIERIVEIFDHPEVTPESSQHPFLSYEKVSSLFEADADSSIVLVATAEAQVEGYLKIELNRKPRAKHVATLGMAVHPAAQGKGVGNALINSAIDQADNWLNIIRLELEVYSDNKKAINLYSKYGFENEGVSKYAAFKNGEYASLLRMARINKKFSR